MGFLFGTYIVLGLVTESLRARFVHIIGLDRLPKFHRVLQVAFTFLLVSCTWIFFRAPDMPTAYTMLGRILTGWGSAGTSISAIITKPIGMLGLDRYDLIIALCAIAALFSVEYLQQSQPLGAFFEKRSVFVRSFSYAFLMSALVILGVFATKQFIYFQF
jgi:hypothetical protein